MICVQQVDILYTKASRCAPSSTTRNRLPRMFSVQHSGEPYGFERYQLLEWADFVPTLDRTEKGPRPPRNQGDLVIEVTQGMVRLGLRWNHAIGQPPRRDQLGAVSLSKGDVARLIINGRYTSHSGQIYTETSYNVAYADVLQPGVFLEAPAAAVLDMRADLF